MMSEVSSRIISEANEASASLAPALVPDPGSAFTSLPSRAGHVNISSALADPNADQPDNAASLVSSDDFVVPAAPPEGDEARFRALARVPREIFNQNGWFGWETGAHQRQVMYHSHRTWARLRLLFIAQRDEGSPLSRLDGAVIWHLAIRVLHASLSSLKTSTVESPVAPWRGMRAAASRAEEGRPPPRAIL